MKTGDWNSKQIQQQQKDTEGLDNTLQVVQFPYGQGEVDNTSSGKISLTTINLLL